MSDSHGHVPTTSELLGRMHQLESRFAVHEERCEGDRLKMNDLITRVERLHNNMKLLHDDQVSRRSVWWTLSVVAIVLVTLFNIILGVINFTS